jgi:hypothetical protein
MRRPIIINQIPPGPPASILNPQRGFFSVILPVARTNQLINPSLEWAASPTFNYTAIGGSIARNAGVGYHGVYGLTVSLSNPGTTDGVYYTHFIAAAGTYVFSMKFRTLSPGLKYTLSVATTGSVDLTAYSFIGTGRWQWIYLPYVEATGGGVTRRLTIRKNDTHTDIQRTFYVDGLQFEQCGAEGVFVTTYIDGDQQPLIPGQFPPPYGWNGTPHNSTSYRLVTTRAGGRVVNLDSYKYKVAGYLGLGLTLVANIGTAPGAGDGAQFQATIARSRSFVINGFVDTTTHADLQRMRSLLGQAFGPDSANPRQPCTLIYQEYDCEREIGSFGRIIASYERGLEETATNRFREDTTLTFTQWLPAILAGDSGVSLNVQTSVTNANDVLQRSSSGLWSAMGTGVTTGASKLVRAIALAPDAVYIGGDFDTVGGVANTSKIAKWTPSTGVWSALGTGITGSNVLALAISPNGTLYAGGGFTDAGGSGADNIASWNGSAWSVVGSATAINAPVNALAIDRAGVVYAGGDFTNAGGVAAADFIAKWDGAAWTALGAALNQSVFSLVFDKAGNLFLGGNFTDAGAVANADHIAMWDPVAQVYTALGTGANNNVFALAIGLDGILYAGGNFTTLNGAAIPYLGRWNGGGWLSLGNGVNNSVRAITVSRFNGLVYIGGDFTTANGITLPDQMAIWNGSAFVAVDVDLPGSAAVYAFQVTPANVTYIGYSTTGTATAAGVTTATNTGTARAYPIVTITGPSSGSTTIYQFLNVTTGKLLYMNLTIATGETVTLTASPQGARLISDFRGDVTQSILPGSSPDFALEKGDNVISFFSAGSTVTATMRWTIGYMRVADLTDN